MLLVTLKHAGKWDLLAYIFESKAPTFERMMISLLLIISDHAYNRYVNGMLEKYSTKELNKADRGFSHVHFARYATDVTFQPSNRPTGNIDETKLYYSGKHKLYGLKTEVSVLPNGIAVFASPPYPGSRSDLDIFRTHVQMNRAKLRKRSGEHEIRDTYKLSEKYPNLWAVIVDKGCYGAAELVRAIHPIKKPANQLLSLEQAAENRNICGDRIVVENFFGRMCSLWAIMSTKYRWKTEWYIHFTRLCLALTNFHIEPNPIRSNDGAFYEKMKKKLYYTGVKNAEKRRVAQQHYRDRRRQRISKSNT